MDPTRTSPIRYRKLPGVGVSFVVRERSTLWAGPDHLLLVVTRGYTEEYKRFYFKDIKAIVVRRTRAWRVTNMVVGGIAAVTGGLAALVFRSWFGGGAGVLLARNWIPSENAVLGIALLIVAIPALIVFLANLFAGPTCVCHLRTPVQEEKLGSLKRLRTARKAMARIRPLIEAVQGTLSEEELARMAATLGYVEVLPKSQGEAPPEPAPEPSAPDAEGGVL